MDYDFTDLFSETETEMPKIVVERRDVYGVERIYPICDKAKQFAAIAKTKTLSPEDLRSVSKLGFRIVQQVIPICH